MQDVDGVDFVDARFGDRPRDGALADALGELLAALGLQHFGIAQAVDAALRIEDDGGGDDRAGERTAACFVDAADQAACERGLLEQVAGEGLATAQRDAETTHLHCATSKMESATSRAVSRFSD